MEKKVLGIQEIVNAFNAINHLLTFEGVPNKAVYWFGRNRNILKPIVKKWFEIKSKDILEKYVVDIPGKPFIPVGKYQEWKEKFTMITKDISNGERKSEELLEIIGKVIKLTEEYEIKSEAQKGVPIENKRKYQEEMENLITSTVEEIEFYKIPFSQQLQNVLSNLNGEEQLALEFMIEEESIIKIAPRLIN